MKANLTNALAAMSSLEENNNLNNTTGQTQTPVIKVVGMNQTNKDTANEAYLQDNSKPLMEEGFHDGSRTNCSMETFSSKLQLIKSRYLSWCRSHQDIFTDQRHEIMDEYRTFIQSCENKIANIDEKARIMEEKASALRTEIQQVVSRNYKAVDVLKVIFNIMVLLALGTWVAIYYGSAMYLTSCSPDELIDNNGEVIQLFNYQNMIKGWPLALFPLAGGTLAGFLRKNTWSFIAEMGIFLVLDIFLSLSVEQKIGEGYAMMDIPYAFNWNRFMLIICYGIVASIFFCESSHSLSKTLLLNEFNTKRTAAKEAEVQFTALQEKLGALHQERNLVDNDRLAAEQALKRAEEKEIYTYWYEGATLIGLFNSYFEGWARFLTSSPECEDPDRILERARSIIRQNIGE